MSNLKYFRRSFFVLFISLLMLCSSATVFAVTKIEGTDDIQSTIDMEWVDRATIKVNNVNVVDGDNVPGKLDFDQSTEASAVRESNRPGAGEAGLNRMINIQAGGGAAYTDQNIFDGENYFDHDTCNGNTSVVFDNESGQDYRVKETNRGAIIFDGFTFLPEDPGVDKGGYPDCRFVFTGPASGGRSRNGIIRLITEMGKPENKDIWFKFDGDDTLKRVDNKQSYQRFKPADGSAAGDPDVYLLKDAGGVKPNAGCDGSITRVKLNGDQRKNKSNKRVAGEFITCDEAGNFNIVASRNGEEGATDEIKNNPTDSTTPSGEPTPECEIQLFNPLTWLMCPLITAGVGAVQTLDNAITSQLNFDTKKSDSLLNENSPGGKALFNAWASFRYISLGLLLVIGLVMIMSQALSFGVFDAYTIKKILPKMLIGIIGVSVSWYLCKFAIEIANDLGLGVRSLLYGPFKTLGPAQFNQGVSSLLTVGAGVAVLGLGVLGILSFIVTALMAVMIAFAILVFRRILIILLVVTAPVAIICWILPNTQRVWKLWWDFFSRALIVFPIISLFIAGGRVVAAVATTTSSNGKAGFTESAIAFIAYFGPYFALPAAFRLAGGAIATIGGLANDRSRGAFDRLKNFRGERSKKRVAEFRNAGLYNNNTRRGRIGNKIGGWAFDADERLPYFAGARGGKYNPFRNQSMVIGDKIEHAAKEQTTEMYKKWNNDGDANDKFFAAMGGSMSDLTAPTAARLRAATDAKGRNLNLEGGLDTREKFEKAIAIMSQSDDSTERLAANALSRNMGSVLNKTRDGNGYASIHGASMLGLSTHGFGSEESMVEMANKIKDETGHNEFAESMLVFSEVNGTSGRKAGYSHSIDKEGNIVTGKSAGRDWARASSKSAPDIARLKKRQAVEDTQALVGIMQYAKTDDAGRAALRQKWAAEGLDDVAIRNRTDGYFSDAAVMDPNVTDTQRNAAAAAKDAFLDKARTADQTLFALTQTYTGAATDTAGAITKVIEDNAGIIGQVGSTLSAAEKAALQNRGGGGGGGGLGGANLGGGGLGGGGVGGGGL